MFLHMRIKGIISFNAFAIYIDNRVFCNIYIITIESIVPFNLQEDKL